MGVIDVEWSEEVRGLRAARPTLTPDDVEAVARLVVAPLFDTIEVLRRQVEKLDDSEEGPVRAAVMAVLASLRDDQPHAADVMRAVAS